MQINFVEYKDGVLALRTPPSVEVYTLIRNFKAGDYEIVRKKKKRSTDANSYCWELISKIAEKVQLPREEVYKQCIRDYGQTETVYAKTKTVAQALIAQWGTKGIGWQGEIIDFDENGYSICLYFGSSSYDSTQFSRFVDGIISECKQLGIETMSPQELASLLAI